MPSVEVPYDTGQAESGLALPRAQDLMAGRRQPSPLKTASIR
jgi:hypothetical protein